MVSEFNFDGRRTNLNSQNKSNRFIFNQFFLSIYFQLHLGVESIRAPEIMFQPSMVGSSEAGLHETIDFVLKMFTAEEQEALVENVFVTGGCAKFPGDLQINVLLLIISSCFDSVFLISVRMKTTSFG